MVDDIRRGIHDLASKLPSTFGNFEALSKHQISYSSTTETHP